MVGEDYEVVVYAVGSSEMGQEGHVTVIYSSDPLGYSEMQGELKEIP